MEARPEATPLLASAAESRISTSHTSGDPLSNIDFQGRSFAVTGGCGFLGTALVRALASRGASLVRALDVRVDASLFSEQAVVEVVQVDVCDGEAMRKAVQGVDCVLHVAVYFGMPAFFMRGWGGKGERERMHAINVQGTESLVEACRDQGVRALVYTSSVNVVFNGKQRIERGEESMAYPPLESFDDHYGETKQLAERCVLKADGLPSTGSGKKGTDGKLRTCSLRPNGIWGPSRACMAMMKSVEMLRSTGGNFFSIAPSERSDWTHVDNLVQAQLLAASRLLSSGDGADQVGGKAYFVTDDEVVNVFSFVGPVLDALGLANAPCIPVPMFTMYASAYLGEVVCAGLRALPGGCLRRAAPPMTLLEARKVGVTHHFSVARARRELGYSPRKSAELWPETAAFFAAEFAPAPPVERPPVAMMALIFAGMAFVTYAAFFCGADNHAVAFAQALIGALFPAAARDAMEATVFQRDVMARRIFAPMVAAHCSEALVAAVLASDRGLRTFGWGVQTALFGYPSLRLLTKRRTLDGVLVALFVCALFLSCALYA